MACTDSITDIALYTRCSLRYEIIQPPALIQDSIAVPMHLFTFLSLVYIIRHYVEKPVYTILVLS